MSTIQLSLFIEPTKHSVRPESALQSHVTLIRFMIAVHIFSISESTVCQNGAFWWMNAVWDLQSEEFFNYFKRVVCHAVLLVNSDLISLEFTVFSVNIFFHFLLISIGFFPIIFHADFFSIAIGFYQLPVLILITELKNMLLFFIQTSCVNNSIIRWIRNAKFLQYRFESTRIYLGRFSNALAKGDQAKVLDAQSQIYIISFFRGKLFLWIVFRNLIFAYHDLLQKIQIF